MRLIWSAFILLLALSACSVEVQTEQKESFVPRSGSQAMFVVPFTTIMVPVDVSEGLFDRFVDNLNSSQTENTLDYIILKQGLDNIDAAWLGSHDYVTGEIFAYVEESGSSMASIRAKSRIRLFQAGQPEATLELNYPVEIFYEKDRLALVDARRKIAMKISDSMSQKLQAALSGR